MPAIDAHGDAIAGHVASPRRRNARLDGDALTQAGEHLFAIGRRLASK
jgi:hypothetical protein